jgi:hemerythrin-like domain-containing protein
MVRIVPGPEDVTQVGRVAPTGTRIETGIERPAVVDVDDGVAMLLAFHADIRRALDDLDAVASGAITDPDSVAAVRDFLSGPLAWHDEDEEVTILARLRRRRVWSIQLTHVTGGHEKLEDLLDDLVPLFDTLPTSRPVLREAATRLRALLVGHLALEEQHLFPLVRRVFDRDALVEMGAEIAARHARREGRAWSAVKAPPPLRPLPATATTSLVSMTPSGTAIDDSAESG